MELQEAAGIVSIYHKVRIVKKQHIYGQVNDCGEEVMDTDDGDDDDDEAQQMFPVACS